MAIDYITSDLVRIEGQVFEIRDSRTPDIFDEMSARDNKKLQARHAKPLSDYEIDTRYMPEYGISHETIAYQQIPRLIDIAKQASIERAISHRNFKVGAAGYAVSYSKARVGYLFGANNTPYPGAPKRCAEMQVINKAIDRGFDHLVALAVFGPSEFADVNEAETDTLHPCQACRELFKVVPLVKVEPVTGEDTLIVTSNDDNKIELMFARDLLAYHGS